MVSSSIVNVCFHGVGTTPRAMEPGEDRYWVSVDQFYGVLDEIMTWPSVRISFDDGNASDAEIALPALVERGLTADFFVLAGRFGQPGSLTEDGVRELQRHHMTIGTHGMWHRSWRAMDPQESTEELVDARDRIAAVAGSAVTTAACPLGLYDRRLLADLRRQGYTHVFTSDRRPATGGAWLQPRFSVRREDTAESVRASMLHPAPLVTRARGVAVGVVKRWR
jgi:peptidoglycan/xylan/chitin deacetylase (PgdA/CDA1 family)